MQGMSNFDTTLFRYQTGQMYGTCPETARATTVEDDKDTLTYCVTVEEMGNDTSPGHAVIRSMLVIAFQRKFGRIPARIVGFNIDGLPYQEDLN